jgi:hypothetical protein
MLTKKFHGCYCSVCDIEDRPSYGGAKAVDHTPLHTQMSAC